MGPDKAIRLIQRYFFPLRRSARSEKNEIRGIPFARRDLVLQYIYLSRIAKAIPMNFP